jgi:hypothetical protein
MTYLDWALERPSSAWFLNIQDTPIKLFCPVYLSGRVERITVFFSPEFTQLIAKLR